LKHKFGVTPSAVYCTLEHFTFSHLSAICHIILHVILLKQKNKNQKFTQGTTHFTNLDKTKYQLSELDVGTKCPDMIDTYSVKAKLNVRVVPAHNMKAYAWVRGIHPVILSLDNRWW
jgi:hypothetical protein